MLPIIFTCKELIIFKPWEANEYFITNSIKPAFYSLPSKSPCLSGRAHYFKYESNGWTFPVTPSIIIFSTGVAAMLEGPFK